jgi:hypothetical protein
MGRRLRRRVSTFSLVVPFLLPLVVLGIWIVTQSLGQVNEPQQIIASIDASGTGTTYLSTIMTDGSEAVWTCTSGSFLETGEARAWGRNVTWQADPGFEDSVTVTVASPTSTDSITFLPVIPELTPMLTVSAAYHLAILERSRDLSLPPGLYTVRVTADALRGYDGLTVLIARYPGGVREAWALFPGDTLSLELPLGAEFEAVGLDRLEDALDNSGGVIVRFLERDDSP